MAPRQPFVANGAFHCAHHVVYDDFAGRRVGPRSAVIRENLRRGASAEGERGRQFDGGFIRAVRQGDMNAAGNALVMFHAGP